MIFKKANMSMLTMIIIGLIVVLIVVSMNNSLFQKTDNSVEETFSFSNLHSLASNEDSSSGIAGESGINQGTTVGSNSNGEGKA